MLELQLGNASRECNLEMLLELQLRNASRERENKI